MRVELRIVAGSLRGRKVTCDVHPGVRPTPQMVREALFSILGNAVPDRPFIDVFAGTGVVGLEALSRGASEALFIERDFRQAEDIEGYLKKFQVAKQARVLRTDVYRWATLWHAPSVPVTIFISPPFADYGNRGDQLRQVITELERKMAPDSVLVLQGEHSDDFENLLQAHDWDLRRYGRNCLAFWVKDQEPETSSQQSDAP